MSNGAERQMDTIHVPSFYDRLQRLGLPTDTCRLLDIRRIHSHARLEEMSRRLRQSEAAARYDRLGIYTAGSHARGEASQHSDIDLWFIRDDRDGSVDPSSNTNAICVMADVIREMRSMDFPSPSNDGEFLKVLSLREILQHLGGVQDDYKNHFTARMLLMLESRALYGKDVCDSALEAIVDAYLRDYDDHSADFRPTFLINDISRYWKTLCLNYENKRNQADSTKKIKQKIKNFKLGYSRLLTCFATVAVLTSSNTIAKVEILNICQTSPIERLLTLAEGRSSVTKSACEALVLYHWFLTKTEMDAPDLEAYFSDRDDRIEAFENMRKFGDKIYEVVRKTAEEMGTLRYLVV